MKKIIVIGCPGAGKSYFSRLLHEKTKIPLHHLDLIYNLPDKTIISRDEFDEKLKELIKNDSWILDGNYNRTLEIRMEACDTIFFLDYPLDMCLLGAKERIGKERDDFPWFEDKLDENFKQKILDFSQKGMPRIYELLKQYKNKEIHIFHSRDEANSFIEGLKIL